MSLQPAPRGKRGLCGEGGMRHRSAAVAGQDNMVVYSITSDSIDVLQSLEGIGQEDEQTNVSTTVHAVTLPDRLEIGNESSCDWRHKRTDNSFSARKHRPDVPIHLLLLCNQFVKRDLRKAPRTTGNINMRLSAPLFPRLCALLSSPSPAPLLSASLSLPPFTRQASLRVALPRTVT